VLVVGVVGWKWYKAGGDCNGRGGCVGVWDLETGGLTGGDSF
jgi:hypothetical protein